MQRLNLSLITEPPRGTGYWCSISRLLFGVLLLVRIGQTHAPPLFEFHLFLPLILGLMIAGCVAAGIYTRMALVLASLSCLSGFYISLFKIPVDIPLPLSGSGSFGEPTNMYFIGVILLCLVFTPSADYFSVDAILKKKKPKEVPLWGVQLALMQVCAMYFWAAVAKLDGDFVRGYSLELAWVHTVAGSLGYSHSSFGTAFFQYWGLAVILAEFALSILFFVPRFRKIGIAAGLVFHFAALALFPVGNFTLALAATYLMFLDPPKHQCGIGTAESEARL